MILWLFDIIIQEYEIFNNFDSGKEIIHSYFFTSQTFAIKISVLTRITCLIYELFTVKSENFV